MQAARRLVRLVRYLIQVPPELCPDPEERWRSQVLCALLLANLALVPPVCLAMAFSNREAWQATLVVATFVSLLFGGLLSLARFVHRGLARFGWPAVPAIFAQYIYSSFAGYGALDPGMIGQCGGIVFSTLIAGVPGTTVAMLLALGSNALVGFGALTGLPFVPRPELPRGLLQISVTNNLIVTFNVGVALLFFQLLHRRLLASVEAEAARAATAAEQALLQRALVAERELTLRAFGHEVSNPLTVALLALDMARLKLQKAGDVPAEMTTAMGSLRRVAALTAAISSIDRQARRERCELRALCRQVAEEQAVLLGERLRLELPEGEVPVPDADPARLQQVIVNLLGNAAKYSQGPITLSLVVRGGEAVLSVRDEGPGIPEAAVARLFHAFFRATEDKGPPGLGLGLYICQRIVERHGGRIWLEATSTEGSTFCVALPLRQRPGS